MEIGKLKGQKRLRGKLWEGGRYLWKGENVNKKGLTPAILIIRAGALGDTLSLMPAIEVLRRDWEITLIGRHPGIEVLSQYVNRVMDYETCGIHLLFDDNPKGLNIFNIPSHEKIIIFTVKDGHILKKNLRKIYPQSEIYIYPPFPQKNNIHISKYISDCINQSGIPCNPDEAIKIAISRPLLKTPHENNQKHIDILIHPGSGSKKKNLPPEFWIDFISMIESRKISILFGPAEEYIIEIFQGAISGNNIVYIISPTIKELINIIRSCKIYLGHDSGVTHLSAMLGIKTIAIYPEDNITMWRPLGPEIKVLRKDLIRPGTLITHINQVFHEYHL